MQSQRAGSRATSRAGGFGTSKRWSDDDEEYTHRPHVYMPGDEWESHHEIEKKPGVYYMPRHVEQIDIHYDRIKWPLYDDFVFTRKKNCPHLPYTPKKVKMMLGLKKAAKEVDNKETKDEKTPKKERQESQQSNRSKI